MESRSRDEANDRFESPQLGESCLTYTPTLATGTTFRDEEQHVRGDASPAALLTVCERGDGMEWYHTA